MATHIRTIDHLRIHPKAGTLSSEAASRWRPHEHIVPALAEVELPDVYVQRPYQAINTPYMRSILLAKTYSVFRPQEGEFPHPIALAGAVVGMLTNLLDPQYVFRGNEMQEAFREAGVRMHVTEYRTALEIEALARTPAVVRFLGSFDFETRERFMNERDQQVLCVGIILLTLGKNVNPQNYSGWLTNRIRTFVGALGILPDRCVWTSEQCPTQEAMATSYSFLSASFQLRRLVFRICVAAARINNRIAALFREVVMLLQGVEMGHILMIDRYIFSKYPELLRIRALRDNMDPVNNALAYLASVDPGERYFVKLLYTKEQTAPINRNNFNLLATAAIAAAQTEIPSMRFYRGGNVTGTTGVLIETVKQYLTLRLNLSYIAITHSDYAYMAADEKKKYLEQAEAIMQGVALPGLPAAEVPFVERVIPRVERP